MRDYAPSWSSAALERPRFAVQTGSAFDLGDGGGANHEEGYAFLNLDLRSGDGTGRGFFAYNDIDDVLICGTRIEGFAIGVHVGGSNPPEAGSDGLNARVLLHDAEIVNSPSQGYLGACDGCEIQNSRFDNNGFAEAVVNHNIYLDPHVLTKGMLVAGNQLTRSAVFNGKCSGTSLVAHGLFEGLYIVGNTVEEPVGGAGEGCWGISVDAGWASTPEAFSDVVISGNSVINVGNTAIGVSSCDGCFVENNVIVHEQSFGSRLIAVPVRSPGVGDAPTTEIAVRNNTLFTRSAASVTGIAVGQEGTAHVVVNNLILSAGTGKLTCFDYDLPGAAFQMRDWNVCFASSATTLNWTRGVASLQTWRGQSGSDTRSFIQDPRLWSTELPYDWGPGPFSPLINAGSRAFGAALDHSGNFRDAYPDIGALER